MAHNAVAEGAAALKDGPEGCCLCRSSSMLLRTTATATTSDLTSMASIRVRLRGTKGLAPISSRKEAS